MNQGGNMCDLDIVENIESIDKSNMMNILVNFAEQYRDTVEESIRFEIPESYKQVKNIAMAGMGGSAIGGDLIRSLFSGNCPIPIIINRDYDIPGFVDESTLFIAASYSGNTEETLSAFDKALRKKAKAIAISCGGSLQEKSEKAGIPHFEVKRKGLQPRCAFGYMFTPMVFFISKLGFMPDQSRNLEEASEIISRSALELSPEVPIKANLAKQLALALYNRLPIIYAPQRYFDVVAMRWKGQINENSKAMAFYNVIPEMNHNEIVGWGIPLDIAGKRTIVMLTNKNESERISKRIEVTSYLIPNTDGQVKEVESKGESPLAKALYLIYLGDFTSYYLAILNGVDPTPVDRIGLLKAILGK
jgi:glucose/mannose-6-phosphate isomerase